MISTRDEPPNGEVSSSSRSPTMLGLFSLLALGAPANNGHHDLSPAPNEAHHSSASALALLNGKLMLNSGSPASAYVQRLYEEAVAESNETYVAEMLDGTVHAENRLRDALNNMRNERNQARNERNAARSERDSFRDRFNNAQNELNNFRNELNNKRNELCVPPTALTTHSRSPMMANAFSLSLSPSPSHLSPSLSLAQVRLRERGGQPPRLPEHGSRQLPEHQGCHPRPRRLRLEPAGRPAPARAAQEPRRELQGGWHPGRRRLRPRHHGMRRALLSATASLLCALFFPHHALVRLAARSASASLLGAPWYPHGPVPHALR